MIDQIIKFSIQQKMIVGLFVLGLIGWGSYSLAHLPMARYYRPEEFQELKRIALDLGFGHVESGPLVRSSYHAHEQADSYAART